MTEQIDLFNVPEYRHELTDRQWKLHDFFSLGKRFKNEEEMIEGYENWLLQMGYTRPEYSYHYFEDKKNNVPRHNMGSLRAMRADKRALRNADIIQKTVTDDGFAKTLEEEEQFFDGWWGRIARELKLYYKCKKKRRLNRQQRLTFGRERSEIQTILEDEKEEI